MVDLNSLLGPFAPGGSGQSSPMSMPLLGSPAYQQQQGQRRQAASQLEIQQALDLARALQQQASPENERITSPWQVVGKMAQALGGQLQMRQAAQLEQGRRAALGNAYESAFPSESDLGGTGGNTSAPANLVDAVKGFEGYSPTAYNDGKQYSIGWGTKATSPTEQSDPGTLERRLRTELGQATSFVDSVAPNAPTGVKQALASLTYNAGTDWANAGLGKAVASGDYGTAKQLLQQYTHANGQVSPGLVSRRATEASWFDNPLGGGGSQATNGAPGLGQGGQPLGFSPGGPGGNAPNGAMAIADALAGGRQPAGGPQSAAGAPSGAGVPGGGQGVLAQPRMGPYGPVYVEPHLIPRRPVLNRQAFQTIMALGGPDDQTRALEMLKAQQLPIEVKRPWGTVAISPQNVLSQQWISNEDKASTKINGNEFPTRTTYDFAGHPTTQYLFGGQYGGLDDLLAWSSRANAQKVAEEEGAKRRAQTAPDIVKAEAEAAGAKTGAETTARIGAENTPEAIAAAAQKAAGIKKAESAPDVAAAEAQAAATKETARLQAGLQPGIVQGQAQAEAQKQEASTYAGKTAETYVQRQSNIEKTAQAAQDELPQLELLKNAIRDPNFRSGWQANNISEMSSALRQLGLGQGQIATLLQFAQKAGAAGSLENIQEMAQSGAVRVPEMNMIKQSNFDPHNTPEANFAVVDTRRRLAERRLEVANFANQYMNTGNILGGTGKGPGHLDHNFDQQVRDYYAQPDHKLFSDKEIENYNQLFDRSAGAGGPGGAAQPQSKIEPPAAAIAELKANPTPQMQKLFDNTFKSPGLAAQILGAPTQVPMSR